MKLSNLNECEVVELNNQEEIDAIIKIAHELGFKWWNGGSYIGFKMPDGLDKCYINFPNGFYCAESIVKARGYKVYPASLFIENNENLTLKFKKYDFDGKFVEILYYITEKEMKKIFVSFFKVHKAKWYAIGSDGQGYNNNLYVMEE